MGATLNKVHSSGTGPSAKGPTGMDRRIDTTPQRRRRRVYTLVGAAAVAVLSLVLYRSLAAHRVRVEAASVDIGTVVREPFKEYIPINGAVQPITTVMIDALEGGTVEAVYAEDGRPIQQGDPILKLSNPQLHMDAINREAQLLDQQNNLRNTRLAMDQQTTQLKDQLLELDYALQQAERTYRTNQALQEKGLVAQQEHDRSMEELEKLKAQRVLLKQNIRTDSLFRVSQVDQINSSLDLIHSNLEFLKENLENLTVRAPISGQLSGLRADLGSTKQRGDHLAQIDVMTDLKLRGRVPEHYVGRVVPDLKASFAFGGTEHLLRVGKVFPEVSNGEFEVDLFFDGERPEAIKRGQNIQVRLQLGEESEAVLLPRGPFFQDTGGQWVYVIENGVAHRRDVRLGRQNPEHYEVLEGLAPDERVLISRYDRFNNADEVVIE
ncbi:MAG: efflux RND transporter periplasmic adaptor subunit [Flavobacteriales bacterium]|nr:efflux RND transporter periplasmic adaptor subunit [Flavobacteriales bacterium]